MNMNVTDIAIYTKLSVLILHLQHRIVFNNVTRTNKQLLFFFFAQMTSYARVNFLNSILNLDYKTALIFKKKIR